MKPDPRPGVTSGEPSAPVAPSASGEPSAPVAPSASGEPSAPGAPSASGAPSAEELFAGRAVALDTLAAVSAVLQAIGPVTVRVSKSQVAFRRGRGFAWLWVPGQYLRGDVAPVVLSVALGRHDLSPRWKQVAHPTTRHWIHHLEVHAATEIDEEVVAWLAEAAARAIRRDGRTEPVVEPAPAGPHGDPGP